jgi:uncharacterized membrane protein YhiD involved in acid resistance
MLEGFSNNILNTIEAETFLGNLIVALLCGLIISIVYRIIYRGPHYSTSFVQAMVILSMITSLVIMVIGNNLARAFGLVGAMSIIRFRTAVKDTQDIIFIFFALASGMAAGVGLKGLAFLGTILISLILLSLNKFKYAAPRKLDFLLQFHSSLADGESTYIPIIQKYCKRNKLINIQSMTDDEYELSYQVYLRDKKMRTKFISDLNKTEDIEHVRLYYDDDQN